MYTKDTRQFVVFPREKPLFARIQSAYQRGNCPKSMARKDPSKVRTFAAARRETLKALLCKRQAGPPDTLPLNPLLFKASAAENGTALVRPKWHGSFCAALGTDGAGFRARSRSGGCSLGLALFAVLGVVCELLGMEKQLFIGGEDKVLPAHDTLQDPICKFHLRLSDTRGERMPKHCSPGSRSPESLL
jgi:hypothetical protein